MPNKLRKPRPSVSRTSSFFTTSPSLPSSSNRPSTDTDTSRTDKSTTLSSGSGSFAKRLISQIPRPQGESAAIHFGPIPKSWTGKSSFDAGTGGGSRSSAALSVRGKESVVGSVAGSAAGSVSSGRRRKRRSKSARSATSSRVIEEDYEDCAEEADEY